jgi:hypothetical protein
MVNGVHEYSSWLLATGRQLGSPLLALLLFKVNEKIYSPKMPFRTLSGAEGEESAPLL